MILNYFCDFSIIYPQRLICFMRRDGGMRKYIVCLGCGYTMDHVFAVITSEHVYYCELNRLIL